MTTVQQAYLQLRTQLQKVYDAREAAAIAAAVIAHITGFDNTGRLINKQTLLTGEQEERYNIATTALLLQQPLQYVLQEAPFYGMDLYVNEHVLIPRPETEELVDWIIQDARLYTTSSILDIGTGSGCIPIALKKQVPAATVHAVDISPGALAVAKKNAELQNAEIHFYLLDILNKSNWKQLQQYDVIVSNPPYITEKEAAEMHNNVLKFEPHIALFVPNEKPLLFYEAIASFGIQHLTKNGSLFFEINEAYGKNILEMLAAKGYKKVELKKDMQGKDRMIKATLLG